MARSDFAHLELNMEIETISGHYMYQNECRLDFEGNEILYYTGYGLTNTSCCGPGGCTFSLVAGFIKKWKYRLNEENIAVTEVEQILDEKIRKKIEAVIIKKENTMQVNFQIY